MIDLASPIAIVAHDAGAANIIVNWVDAAIAKSCRPVMEGPALKIWRERFPDHLPCSLSEALGSAASMISGTGWASDLEHEARAAARHAGIHSVAVIDHWLNYRARFSRSGIEVLPDEIWVTDKYAYVLARDIFRDVPVQQKPNLYLDRQAKAAGPRPDNGDLLFVAEPARSEWGRGRAGEFQALDYLTQHAGAAGIPSDCPMRLRPHPSDPPGKYDAWINSHPNWCLDDSRDIAEAIRGARWVAGLQSFALVVAIAADRPALSALPDHAPACALPHDKVVHLRRLVASQNPE
ncbi:hypothetical protein GON01_08645 [Sphingomonas sp. MAH-20]|uniref:Uncharacterized protein n=1 Tax=Sphingomonas horti TaxID=2682842 RepID=A0A6I4J0C6_9SPHN|nr:MULTISPECIES: hypothetical protein [Sphingomonas]MBA2919759.1 hypothetical protein [Sphingomonas sp. CGMCC 1.13658]MVO78000.1 hypothetical protein [Sphingomonas horti]